MTSQKSHPILGFFFVALLQAHANTISIIAPSEGARVPFGASAFVIGSVAPSNAPLSINGTPLTPWRTGGFLYIARVQPGTNTLVCRSGTHELRRSFCVLPPAPVWDGHNILPCSPLRPLGVSTGETVQLACRAPVSKTLYACIGERTTPLAASVTDGTLYTGSVAFPSAAEDVPVTFFAEGLKDASAATVTAQPDWPCYRVSGNLFEVRVREQPGDGDTLGFLTPGFIFRSTGRDGAHIRTRFDGRSRFIEARHLTPFDTSASPAPPADTPMPNLSAGYGPHPPTNRSPDEILIVIDPGHGGRSYGAVGPTGLPEKQATLAQAQFVRDALAQSRFRVLLTRDRDCDLDLYDRVRLAYAQRAAAFISIHYNACGPNGNPRASRHIATYAWNAIGLDLARAIHPHLTHATPIPDGGVRTASFAVCRNPAVPSCLLELDFIVTPEGEDVIQTPARQQQVAEAILAGIRDWMKAPTPY